MIEATILGAVGGLASLASEYVSADNRRRAVILEEAEQAFQIYKSSLAGLPAVLAADDAAADAAVAAMRKPAQPPPIPIPSPVPQPSTPEVIGSAPTQPTLVPVPPGGTGP